MTQKYAYYKPTVELDWATNDTDARLIKIARLSNPENENNPDYARLLNWLMQEGHVSPFDMANMCVEVHTPRDIMRQMLRHSSIKPQEFSQRYADPKALEEAFGAAFVLREFREKHPTNRQLSVEVPEDDPRHAEWAAKQTAVIEAAREAYEWCLANGGAKECARVVLPEGNTMSRGYFNGRIRDWIFYLKSRLDWSTQKEHRGVAGGVLDMLARCAPVTAKAFFNK